VGDWRYGRSAGRGQRLALHAARLAFAHPLSGEPLAFESPLPAALAKLLAANR
jgi:23S rRNA pseudouridine1911/1915/1917 synthase